MFKKTLIGLSIIALATGCKSTSKPAETTQITNANSVEVILPIGAESDGTTGWNVYFTPYVKKWRGEAVNSRGYFYEVRHKQLDTANLMTEVCNGEQFDSGNIYKTCLEYFSSVKSEALEDSVKLTITPTKQVKKVGGFIEDVATPNVTTADVIGYIGSQQVTYRSRIKSKYSPEAIKGNFDRLLQHHQWGQDQVDAAHRQFKDTYLMKMADGSKAHISVGFYPYRDGSIIEFVASGVTSKNNFKRTINWTETFKQIEDKLTGIVNS